MTTNQKNNESQQESKNPIERFKNDIRFKHKIKYIKTIPQKKATYQKINQLPENIKNYLNKHNLKLYKHQAELFNKIKENKNVILTTPTASGKTLAFNLPIIDDLEKNPEATALYIYPAKALSNDQLKVLQQLEKELNININPQTYDGDTPRNERSKIRKNSRIILTNPYELHYILTWHHQWEKFYSNLKYIVIDEAHSYRGIFGSNVAFVIRRLKRILKFYGSQPQYILSSATLANPTEFAEKLIDEKFTLINEDSSPKGEKDFILYNPFENPKNKLSIHQETEKIFTYLLLNNLQTLCFTVSRKMAEIIAMWTKKDMASYKHALINKITAYRAGYLAHERREIENGLKKRELLGVTCTNALELGINIGSLDAVIISGYPGTMISTWQQAGRAGRMNQKSIAILIAFENQLDQYFMNNPEFFFDKAHENAIIDLNNKQIIDAHIQCAANELILKKEELKEFFSINEYYIKNLIYEGTLNVRPHGYVYAYDDHPSFNHSLDQLSSSTFKVMNNNQLLEIMELSQVYREAHEGAILINKGETYHVDDVNLMNGIVNVSKKNVEYHTQALNTTEVKIIKKIKKYKLNNFTINFGELEVSEDFYKYKKIHFSKILGVYKLNLPPLTFKTKGLWFTIPKKIHDELKEKYPNEKEIFAGGLHGVEHALIGLFPLHVMCDRFDIGGLSTNYHEDTQEATIFIYDAYEGGIGITEKAAEIFNELTKSTLNLLETCPCKEGCPACIYSPKCGNDNKPLHKDGTTHILKYMYNEMSNQKPEPLTPTTKQDTTKENTELSPNISTKHLIKEYNNAETLYLEEKYDESLQILNRIIQVEKNHFKTLKLKAKIHEKQKNYKNALETYEQAQNIDMENIDIKYKQALMHYKLQDYGYAKDILIDIIKEDNKYSKAYCLIGAILYKQEDYKGSQSFIRRSLSIDSNNQEAYELLEKIKG